VIYVCIPAHNEAATVGVLLWKLRRVLGEFGRDYKLLVLDDASTDDTADVLARYRRSLPLTVIRSEERLGYGRSVERLLREAVELAPYPKRDCAVVLQGDFTERPEDVVGLVKAIEGGADIVAGTLAPESGSSVPRPIRLARRFARLALGRTWRDAPVSDPVSGLRAYRVIVLKKAFRDLPMDGPLSRSDGWAANVELLRLLAPHARRIAEAPLELRYDLQVRPSRFQAWRTLVSLTRLRGGGAWPRPDAEAA
jgi:glycosyltransferase involved in cell wall biosynthesis